MSGCILALVMLLDVSNSVDNARWIQQRNGHADAFRSSSVSDYIQNTGPIAVAVAAFGSNAAVIHDWRILTNRLEALEFADRFQAISRPELEMFTHTGEGMAVSLDLHENVPCNPERRVLDVAADGVQIGGRDAREMRDLATERGITINTIAILNEDQNEIVQREFVRFMNEQVRTQDGFSMTSAGFEDIARTVRRKVELEIIGDSRATNDGIL